MLDDRSLLVLEVLAWSVSAVFALIMAIVKLVEAGQTEERRELTRQRYQRLWATITETGILELPETIILWLLGKKERISKELGRFGSIACLLPLGLNLVGSLVILPWLLWLAYDWKVAAIAAVILPPALLLSNKVGDVGSIYGPVVGFTMVGVMLKLATEASLVTCVILLAVSFPLFVIATLSLHIFLLLTRGGLLDRDETYVLIGFAMALSFLVTGSAFLLGHAAEPGAWVPQTLQMLSINFLCDGMTLVATVTILSAVVKGKRRLSVFLAIVLDLTVAAILACASLWLGLAGTEHALDLQQVLYVLIARAPSGGSWSIGPFFWSMHTAFLPTVAFLAVVLLCWIGRLVVLPVARTLRRGREVSNPLNHTIATLGVPGVIFGIIAKGLDYAQKLTP